MDPCHFSQDAIAENPVQERQRQGYLREKKRNVDLYHKNLKSGTSFVTHKPIELFIESANSCNLRCIMCRLSYTTSPIDAPFVPLELIDKMKKFYPGLIEAHLHGFGEPLLNKKLTDMIKLMRQNGGSMIFDFFTNVMPMNRKISRSIVDAGVDRVTFSIDGSTKETYEAIHRGARWERLLHNLATLNRIKKERGSLYPKLEINLIAMNMNFHEFPGLVKLAADHHIEKIDVKTLVVSDNFPDEIKRQRRIYNPEMDDATIIESQRIAQQHGIEIFFGHYYASKPPSRDAERISGSDLSCDLQRTTTTDPVNGNHSRCFQPWKTFYVKTNGEVKPCCFSTMVMGNLHESTPEEIWNGDEYRKLRDSISRGVYPEGCRQCVAFNLRPKIDDTDHWLREIIQKYKALRQKKYPDHVADQSLKVVAHRRQSFSRSDETADALYRKAQALIKEDKLNDATQLMNAIISSCGDKPLWHNDLGCLYYALGNMQSARAHFEKAIQLDPSFTTALKNLADFYGAIDGRKDDAIKLYRRVMDQKPNDSETMAMIGQLCAHTGCTSGINFPLTKELIRKLLARGVSTQLVPGATLPMDVVFEPPCSLKRMNVSHSLYLGAFSYGVSGFYFGCRIGRYCSFGEQVQIGRRPYPMHYVSTSPFFYKDFKEVLDQALPDDIELNPIEDFHRDTPPTTAKVTEIGNDVWIGHGAFILPGVKIGDGAAVGAMSVVTKDVPPYAVVAGVPAGVVKYRFPEDQIRALLQSRWWEFAPWSLKGAPVDDVNEFLGFIERLRAKGIEIYAPDKIVLSELILQEFGSR